MILFLSSSLRIEPAHPRYTNPTGLWGMRPKVVRCKMFKFLDLQEKPMPAPYELIQSNDHGTMKIGALRILRQFNGSIAGVTKSFR